MRNSRKDICNSSSAQYLICLQGNMYPINAITIAKDEDYYSSILGLLY